MFKISVQPRMGSLLLYVLVLAGFFRPFGHCAARAASPGPQIPQIEAWDHAKYISIDEIRPGMEAYCLTVYKGTEVEKFGLEVVSVARNALPGRDTILVRGTDDRFIETGPVGGCSGSPVYIEGRLAGALAYAWMFSKEPLYGATPIEDMLTVAHSSGPQAGLVFDLSEPIDPARVDRQLSDSLSGLVYKTGTVGSGFQQLPCPLISSGFSADVVQELDTLVRPFGLMAVAGIGGSQTHESQGTARLVPGACLAIPVITGDLALHVVGTVTEVVDDQVYGFGHGFLGYGPVDLPMATGYIHTVVSNVIRSFKFGSPEQIVGALTMDESAAIYGKVGQVPRMIPLTIKVDRYNDTQTRVFDCRLANNQLLTPLVLRWSVAGAGLILGKLPPEHAVQYRVTIGIENCQPITFENVSTSRGLAEVSLESTASLALLMNNPYEKVGIESISVEIDIAPKNILSQIWSVNLSDTKLKPGEELGFEVVVESFLADKKKYQGRLKIPEELAPGKYDLLVCGAGDYLRFLRKAAPYRFVPENLSTLIGALNDILQVKRDRLYCLLVLPPGGMALEKAQLPDLPATKMLVLHNAKRTLTARPYQHWAQKSFRTSTVILDKRLMKITIEK